MLHFEAPADMDRCLVCSRAPDMVRTVRCEYAPRSKDARRGAVAGSGTIDIPLCRDHEGAPDGVVLRGWDWWDMVEAL